MQNMLPDLLNVVDNYMCFGYHICLSKAAAHGYFSFKVSIQPSPASEFWALESRHVVSILRYLIQFLSLWNSSIVGLGLGLVVG